MTPNLLAAEPFLSYVDVEVETLTPGHAVLQLTRRDPLTNHMHSIHAGAQYTLGESTAAAVLLSLALDRLDRVQLLTRSATITYRHPAQGNLQAEASLDAPTISAIEAALQTEQRAECTVNVTISDERGWHVTELSVTCVLSARSIPA